MSHVRSAAPAQRTSAQPSRARAPSAEGQAAQLQAVQPKAAPLSGQSVQQLARAVPVRESTPARWAARPTAAREGQAVQGAAMEPGIPDSQVHQAARLGTRGGGGSLPYLDKIQRAFGGHDVSHVVAHTDWAAKKGAEAMGARAFTTGNHVAFASQPTLHTAAHEAAHVVQQQKGVQLKGGVGRVGDPYEEHADAVADAVVSGKSAEALLAPFALGGAGGGSAVQRDVDLGTKYSAPDDSGYLMSTWGSNVQNPTEASYLATLTNAERFSVFKNTYTLGRNTKYYRWGEYSAEKHFVRANGFDLRTVNQNGKNYGHGLYLADTPFSSAQFGKDMDGACLEVTVPRNTRVVKTTSMPESLQRKLYWDSIRTPDLLEVSPDKWFVLKNDKIPGVSIRFYQPTDEEMRSPAFQKSAHARNSGTNLIGHRALHTFRRQSGQPIRTPANLANRIALYDGLKGERVRQYVNAITRLEYVPFELGQNTVDFRAEYAAFKSSIAASTRYSLYFTDDLDDALTAWATDPFSYSAAQFEQQVLDPFAQAAKQYKASREQGMYEWRRKQSGGKSREINTFLLRLISFRRFLKTESRNINVAQGLSLSSGLKYGDNG